MGKKTNRRTTEDAGDSGARARTTTTTTTTTTRARFSTPIVAMVERVEDATMPTTATPITSSCAPRRRRRLTRARARVLRRRVRVDGGGRWYDYMPERVFAAFTRASRELARRARAEGVTQARDARDFETLDGDGVVGGGSGAAESSRAW